MADLYLALLSAIVFLPSLGALLLAFTPKEAVSAIRYITLAVTAAVFLLVVFGLLDPFNWGSQARFELAGDAAARMQGVFNQPWIPTFNIYYFMGLDGISFPLLALTAFVSMLAMGASWSITKHVKGYCILFLLLETGMLGVFLALDFFLFYVFWEVMLLPMYFLIGVWGGPRREYAAIKFFLYTLVGSVLMLIAILMLYFHSDLRSVARAAGLYGEPAAVAWEELHVAPAVEARLGRVYLPAANGAPAVALTRLPDSGPAALSVVVGEAAGADATAAILDEAAGELTIALAPGHASAAEVVAAVQGNPLLTSLVAASLPAGADGAAVVGAGKLTAPAVSETPVHTFNLLALAAQGQHTTAFSYTLQVVCFLLLFIGFAIKVPSVPVHTWLPDAHVEAPTPISMILAGVLLKMGGYGIIRICYPICPFGGYQLAWLICGIGVVSMLYGAFAALAQKDFKRMVAYSSVSHMGYVVLGLGVWSAMAGNNYNPEYWNMGVQGAMFQMIGHGISSPGMFFIVGVIYDRVHHRNLDEFGGLFGRMPVYTALAIGIFFAGLGLPGLCGFIGEVLVVLSVWEYSYVLAVLSAAVVILTAGYILWALQRVYLGPQYKGPHGDHITPMTPREFSIAVPLFVLSIILGVLPYQTVLRYMSPTVTRQTQEFADWTKREQPRLDSVPQWFGPRAAEEPAQVAAPAAPVPVTEASLPADAPAPTRAAP